MNLTQVGPQGTVASQWDLAGRRTRLTYPGSGLYIDYDYLVTGEMVKLRENGATSGVGVLATLAYDDLGRRTGLTFGNGASQGYGYDPVSRLASLTNDLSGTTNDLSQTLAYNPASQIASAVRTGDAYAWTGHFNENKTGTPNGLNQLTQVGAKSLTHDARGNVTAFGTKSFTYSSENLLQTGPNSTTLGYDPLMRLYQIASGATTARLAYDGLDRIAEYDGSNALQRRTVHGPNMDEPFVWYEGTGTADRRFLGSDERGSIISVTDSAGALLGLNKYDEFGNPQSTNLGVWGYTGQAWLPTIGVWYYKARVYDSEGGFFYQTDQIGYEDSPNLYPYVGNDPINLADPFGLNEGPIIVVPGWRMKADESQAADANRGGDLGIRPSRENEGAVIVVTGKRPPRHRSRPILSRIANLLRWQATMQLQAICKALSKLPANGRVRVGADGMAFGGLGGAIGAGVFVDQSGRIGADFYWGWGGGLGAVAGAGVSVGNDSPRRGRTVSNDFNVGIGVGPGGASGSYSKASGGTLTGGVGVGPRLGFAAGGLKKTTYAAVSDTGACQ